MKFIGFGLMLAGVGAGWAGMMYGWGVPPHNWAWIIGGSVGSMVLFGLGQLFMED